jgi:triosephosphate isomerase
MPSATNLPTTRLRPFIVGSGWKMNGTISHTLRYMEVLNSTIVPEELDIFVLPPSTALHAAYCALDPATGIRLGAQNAHWMANGAFTGEVSMAMVKDAGASIVEIGHSERRAAFNESDATVALKVRAALAEALTPLVCVGEAPEIRARGGHVDAVLTQVAAALDGLTPAQQAEVLLAYEPIWAIGEHGRPAGAEEVLEVMTGITSAFSTTRVLYGGGVCPANVGDFVTLETVSGVFAGRSTWAARDLVRLLGAVASALGAPCPTS